MGSAEAVADPLAERGVLLGWEHVARNLQAVHERMAAAAARAGRDDAAIALVAVSKTVPIDGLRAALAAGQQRFGENRVQEALPKVAALRGEGARFDLVGHLQTNKAKHAGAFDMIESVDSVRLAAALDRRLTQPLSILLEVNVSGEASKHGFAPEDLPQLLTTLAGLQRLRVQGLMTVAPLAADAEDVRPIFRKLSALARTHGLPQLSMGMTNDFEVAIEEGATIVRVGRAIFGDR